MQGNFGQGSREEITDINITIARNTTFIDTLQRLIISFMGGAEVVRHCVRLVEISYRGGEMRLTRQKDVFGTASQVFDVLLSELRNWECVPAKSVGVAIVCLYFSTNRSNPIKMHPRCNY